LPGGLVDVDEEPVDAEARELEEETGYRAGVVLHLVSFQPMPGMVDAKHVVFVGIRPERSGGPVGLGEATELAWIPMAQVPAVIEDCDIWNAGTRLVRFDRCGEGCSRLRRVAPSRSARTGRGWLALRSRTEVA
jgi:8-oxo-dGTP pyrophosphatase MutT (NUDIX family)